jgi:sarcosine oxidase, subunit beta
MSGNTALGKTGAEVVVIGGGVSGLSAAWWLARDGVDVAVLEKGIVGWEASGRNGGGCSHYFSPLFAEEQRLWPLMDELLGYPTEFRSDRIRIAMNDHQKELYAEALTTAAGQGFKGEVLSGSDVRKLVPLASEEAVAGYFYHFGGHANPHRTAQAYAWAIQDRGGHVFQHAHVQELTLRSGRVSRVVTNRGTIACDRVVIAAGPQTGNLAKSVGIDLPLVAARAEMIVTEPLPLMPMGGVDGNGLYGRQTLRGNLAYGGGPHEWLQSTADAINPKSTTPLTRGISRRLAELFPRAGHARVIRSWAGVVENTPDGRPVIDRPSDPGNVVIVTMSSVGFGLSPATGHAVRDLIVDGHCGFADLSSFALGRFAALEPDWQTRQGWISHASAEMSQAS